MKASEFVKLRGIGYCKELLIKADGCAAIQAREDSSRVNVDDLKRLVESHELVKEHGGLERAKIYAESKYTAPEVVECMKQAVADVESCQ